MKLGKIHKLTNEGISKLFFGNTMVMPEIVIPMTKKNTGVLQFEQDYRDRIEVEIFCVETGRIIKEIEYYLDLVYEESETQSW